jgi:hypothetical protein
MHAVSTGFASTTSDAVSMSLADYKDGTPMQSVAKGAVDLGKLQDETEKKAAEEAAEALTAALHSRRRLNGRRKGVGRVKSRFGMEIQGKTGLSQRRMAIVSY